MLFALSFAVFVLLQAASATPIAARQASACATLPASIPTPSISYLPDPFTTISGTKVTTLDQWTCRQQEINQLFQRMELGTLPPKPSSVTASLSGNTLTINVSDSGKPISFSVTIQYPSSGTAPYPAIIALDGGSIPAPAGVAIISYNEGDIAQQTDSTSRGKGKFYDLYGSGQSAGALMAWAWGVSRIVDALEKTPSAKINTYSLGVTGCSRDGKGALVAGAFEPRIALTIPQESGSGGDSSWRISDYIGSSTTQTAGEIIGENVWFSTNFNQYVNKVPVLPFDHHMLAGLVAPRALFAIENTDYVWLGPLSAYGDMSATKLIYQAIGKSDNFGFSQVGGHAHCAFPSSQQSDLDAYVGKFLLNKTTTTNIFRSTGGYESQFSTAQWIPWANSIPNLSGSGSGSGSSGGSPTTSIPVASPTTAAGPTPTPSSPASGNCAAHYGQCGGIGFAGPTCCVSGSTCKVSNTYYSQCL